MAKGILMQREHSTGDRASDLPATMSQEENIKVQAFAARLSPGQRGRPCRSLKPNGEEEVHRIPDADARPARGSTQHGVDTAA